MAQDDVLESVPSFHHVVPQDQTQVTRLSSKPPYLQSPLCSLLSRSL